MNDQNDHRNKSRWRNLLWWIVGISFIVILLVGLISKGFFPTFHNHKLDQLPGEELGQAWKNINKQERDTVLHSTKKP